MVKAAGKWRSRLRRLRFAVRWAWYGRSPFAGPVTLVCEHTQPGDVMIRMMAFRGTQEVVTEYLTVGRPGWTLLSRQPLSGSTPTPTEPPGVPGVGTP